MCGCLPAVALMFVTAQEVQAGYSSAVSSTTITMTTADKNPTSSPQVVVYSLTGAQYTQNQALNCHDTVICFGSMPAMPRCIDSMQI